MRCEDPIALKRAFWEVLDQIGVPFREAQTLPVTRSDRLGDYSLVALKQPLLPSLGTGNPETGRLEVEFRIEDGIAWFPAVAGESCDLKACATPRKTIFGWEEPLKKTYKRVVRELDAVFGRDRRGREMFGITAWAFGRASVFCRIAEVSDRTGKMIPAVEVSFQPFWCPEVPEAMQRDIRESECILELSVPVPIGLLHWSRQAFEGQPVPGVWRTQDRTTVALISSQICQVLPAGAVRRLKLDRYTNYDIDCHPEGELCLTLDVKQGGDIGEIVLLHEDWTADVLPDIRQKGQEISEKLGVPFEISEGLE